MFLVERNRLAMVVKNGEIHQIIWTLSKYLGRTTLNTIAALRAFAFHQPNRHELARWPRHHARVLKALLAWMPALFRKRSQIQKRRKISPSMLEQWFVE
jgi:hypothetical protein